MMSTKEQINISTRILIDLWVVVTDEEALKEFLCAKNISPDASLPALVATALILPFQGICLGERACKLRDGQDGEMVYVRQEVSVLNPIEVWRYARERIQTSFLGAVDDISLAQAVLEALVLSNPNPNPMNIGLEIDHFRALAH